MRVPATARVALSPWTCSPRTRARRPAGRISSSSPTSRAPATSVPVATVPKPFIVKTRSTGRRSSPSACRGAASSASSRSAARSASSPSPVRAETRTTGRPSRNDPRTSSAVSCSATVWAVSSARSLLVSTTSPRGIPSRRQIWKCSRVCGITDSSAATTSSTASMPWAPASMLRTKRSWPGTSTNEATSDGPSSACAKPRSIVMPRSFSCGRRSGSLPVSARTSALLPWSMWPAVPTTKERSARVSLRALWSRRIPTRRSCAAWRRARGAPPSRRAR